MRCMKQPFTATRSQILKKGFKGQMFIEPFFCKMSEATHFEKLQELMKLYSISDTMKIWRKQ